MRGKIDADLILPPGLSPAEIMEDQRFIPFLSTAIAEGLMAAGSPNVTVSITQLVNKADLGFGPSGGAVTEDGLAVTSISVEYRFAVSSSEVGEEITRLVGQNMVALEKMFIVSLQQVEGLVVLQVTANPPRISMELLVKPPPPKPPEPNWIAIGLGAGTGLVFVIVFWLWRWRKWKRKKAAKAEYAAALRGGVSLTPVTPLK
jgi:hypothetical protein